jgi:hypothetical protein
MLTNTSSPTTDLRAASVHAPSAQGGASPPPPPPPPLDLGNPPVARAWLLSLRETLRDATSAGEDQTRPPGRRRLGRAMARETITEASEAAEAAIAVALQSVGGE